jgi:formylglycine-generating enzyme required for sulfatase activity
MRSPLAFMKFVAKAALNVVGFGVAGDFAVDVMPAMAGDVYKWWAKGKPPQEVREEVEAAAQLPPSDAHQMALEAVAAEAADKPPEVQQLLTKYLELIPLSIRQSLRRPEDPSGRTVTANFSLKTPNDILPLLPARVPRFKSGDRPAGVGDWVLDELLGMGGFGEVWRARNPHLPDPVALKFCLDTAAAHWLRHEAALLGRVISQGRHPGIVALLDTYLSGDPPCLKYEYVGGGDLCAVMTQLREQPPAKRVIESIRIIHELSSIVAFAHRLSPPIVHRDLKPANILVQPGKDGGMGLRIADFGIGGVASRVAREVSQRGTTQGFFLNTALRGSCTPLYASPQQMRGEEPDPRDDVHALGVIWYQMLTGDLTSGASADWRDEVDSLGLPDDGLRLLGACLSSRAERRPAHAGELAESLARLLPAAPVAPPVVRTPPVPPPPTKPVQPPRQPAGRPPSGPRPLSASLPRHITNTVGMGFVLIPAGSFLMGSPANERDRSTDEGPQHTVTISRPFYLGVHPVTQEQFQRVMGANPSHFSRAGRGRKELKDEDPRLLPVERVPWGSAVAFCRKLSEMREEQSYNREYRLPTEAEWEWACRAGKSGEPFCFGSTLSSTQANFDGSQPYGRAAIGPYLKRPTAVGSYPPNDFGLFDMHGNVWEWCSDWYGEDYYAHSPPEGPQGPADGTEKVLRGGCWSSSGANCRSAYRGRSDPGNHVYRFGFRVVLVPEGL